MRYSFIVNPGSRGGRNLVALDRLKSTLNGFSPPATVNITKTLDDAFSLSRQANMEKYDVIVAVGGDGTINRVLNGFFDENGRRISNAKMGVVYGGTSPDFCKSYGIPIQYDAAFEALYRGRSRQIQLGTVAFTADTESPSTDGSRTIGGVARTKLFACCANIGLGASLARQANSGIRKKVGDFLGTLLSLIKVLKSYHPCDLTVRIDDEQKTISNVFNISVGKTRFIASGIKVQNELAEGDGKFYVLVVNNLKLRNVPRCLWTIYSGRRIADNDVMSLLYCSRFEAQASTGDVEVEFDGDPVGFVPCKIEMAHDPLDLIVG
ncbi:MAG: diacylglycerol kinase [Candidatus Latescibacterota bacterium]|nr:MAG: diacylglycerol kinase [Candidatus Latescibacterota bacterium]